MKKYLFGILLLHAVLAAGPLCAAPAKSVSGAAKWAPHFKGPEIGLMSNDVIVIRYPKTCMVPDKNKVAGPLGENEEVIKMQDAIEQHAKAQEALKEELKEDLLYGTDDERAAAEAKIKAVADMEQAAREELEKLKIELAAKGAVKPQKKEKPAAQPMKEEKTDKYYLENTLPYLSDMLDNLSDKFYNVKEGEGPEIKVYVYVVTSPKLWMEIAQKPSLVTPVRNVRIDKKGKAVLVFASPQNKDKLNNSIGYAVASFVLQDILQKRNKNDDPELAEAIATGFCAWGSDLNCVVEPQRVIDPPVLEEDKLIQPTELFQPRQMNDPVRCLYFTRQSSALVKYIAENGNLRTYLRKAKGGNSGFRSSFQFLDVSKTWGFDYDEFCNKLNKRVFFPLTDSAQSSPNAMAKWARELQDEDDDFRQRRSRSGGHGKALYKEAEEAE